MSLCEYKHGITKTGVICLALNPKPTFLPSVLFDKKRLKILVMCPFVSFKCDIINGILFCWGMFLESVLDY